MWKFDLGMSVSALRNSLCWMLALLCPLSLAAADTGSAVLHTQGGVWVNGFEVAGTTTVFPGDLLETKPGFVANLDADGSSVLIQPESIVKFEGSFLSLDHGSVSVGTLKLMSVHVKCIKVEPVSPARTEYDVADVNGTAQVVARKNDVNISETSVSRKTPPPTQSGPSRSTTVHEGQQATREASKACGAGAAAPPPGSGPALNGKWLAIGIAAAVGVTVICLLFCASTTPISPSQP